MPPVTILSPYSGRPVKVREQDLGRAIRDEQGRVFYVVEDPEHGRYAARTRKGSDKDLQRYREIQANVAQLQGEASSTSEPVMQAHDATGSKRRNPVGVIVLVLILILLAAAGYVYLNYPQWLGLDAQSTGPSDDTAAPRDVQEDAQAPDHQPSTDPAALLPVVHRASDTHGSHTPKPQDEIDQAPTAIETAPSQSAAAPALSDTPATQAKPQRPASPSAQPAVVDRDPRPVIVPTQPRQPRTQPIAFVPAQPRRSSNSYDDFRHTASGLRYKITHVTDGVSARAGYYVTVRYAAQRLDGQPLIDDASQSFILMSGQAIRAFDEGLAGIREGEQLRMLVPRGHSESGILPGIERVPDEPFLLDVQVVSVRPGVTYVVEKHGDIDSRPAMPGDTVRFHYLASVEGRDEVIDTTVHRDKPMRITLGNNEVIKGLELGITGMRPGESRQLTIPPYLAYGKYSVAGGLIPENAVLSFRLTLVGIVDDDE